MDKSCAELLWCEYTKWFEKHTIYVRGNELMSINMTVFGQSTMIETLALIDDGFIIVKYTNILTKYNHLINTEQKLRQVQRNKYDFRRCPILEWWCTHSIFWCSFLTPNKFWLDVYVSHNKQSKRMFVCTRMRVRNRMRKQ